MYVGARMLLRGWKLAYCAESRVRHSHGYTLAQEFRRYFDIGVFNARQAWIRQHFGGASGEGRRFVLSEWGYLLRHCAWRLPESCIRTALKLAGFNLGLRERWLPLWLKRAMSGQRNFWDKNGADG
jgi:rhamnosyltransferase